MRTIYSVIDSSAIVQGDRDRPYSDRHVQVVTVHPGAWVSKVNGFVLDLAGLVSERMNDGRVLVIDLSGDLGEARGWPYPARDAAFQALSRSLAAGTMSATELQESVYPIDGFPQVDLLPLGPAERETYALGGLVGWRLAREIMRAARGAWAMAFVVASSMRSRSMIQTAFMDGARFHLELGESFYEDDRLMSGIWRERRARITVISTFRALAGRAKRQEWAAWLWALGGSGYPGFLSADVGIEPGDVSLVRYVRERLPSVAHSSQLPIAFRAQTLWAHRWEFRSYWGLQRLANRLAGQLTASISQA